MITTICSNDDDDSDDTECKNGFSDGTWTFSVVMLLESWHKATQPVQSPAPTIQKRSHARDPTEPNLQKLMELAAG